MDVPGSLRRRQTGHQQRSIPQTGLFYVMAWEGCAVYRKNSDWFELGKSFYGGTTRAATIAGGGKSLASISNPGGSSGRFHA